MILFNSSYFIVGKPFLFQSYSVQYCNSFFMNIYVYIWKTYFFLFALHLSLLIGSFRFMRYSGVWEGMRQNRHWNFRRIMCWNIHQIQSHCCTSEWPNLEMVCWITLQITIVIFFSSYVFCKSWNTTFYYKYKASALFFTHFNFKHWSLN